MDDNTKIIRETIKQVQPLSEQSLNEIISILTIEHFEKGDTFIQKGRPNNKEYFILDGVCKSYVINPEGEEVTISFFIEKSVLSPHTIRTSAGFSNLHFHASTNVTLAWMHAKKFEDLMISNLEIRNFANTVLQNELMLKVEKEIGLASLSAKERLVAFRSQFKLLENLVPHTEIASYLGITTISLSRLRRDLVRQN